MFKWLKCYDNLVSKALQYHPDHILSVLYTLFCISDAGGVETAILRILASRGSV